MRSLLLVILVLCLYGSQVQGQAFERGYLVLSHGDTVRGEIENAFWEDPPVVVRFRASASTRLILYPAQQLRCVALTTRGRLLRREFLPIDRNAETALHRLPTSIVHNPQPDSVLADVYIEGPATLLGITLSNVHHFYVRREARSYLEMADYKYLMAQNGITVIKDGNDFRGQLLSYFSDCAPAIQVILKAPFTAAGLKAVVQAYNKQCSATQQVGQETMAHLTSSTKAVIRLGVAGGVRYNSMSFIQPNNATLLLNGLDLDGKPHMQGGMYLDVVGPGRRLGLHTVLLASRFGNQNPVYVTGGSRIGTDNFEWRGLLVSFQGGLRGFIPVGQHSSVLFGSGYEINRFLNTTSRITYSSQAYPFLSGFTGSFIPYLEAGLNRQRLTLTLNGRLYQKQYYEYFVLRPWSLSLMLGYRLNADSDSKALPSN